MLQIQESAKIELLGGLDAAVRGTNTHLARILQASQRKIQEQEVFLLPSQKRDLSKLRRKREAA